MLCPHRNGPAQRPHGIRRAPITAREINCDLSPLTTTCTDPIGTEADSDLLSGVAGIDPEDTAVVRPRLPAW